MSGTIRMICSMLPMVAVRDGWHLGAFGFGAFWCLCLYLSPNQ